VTGEVRKVSVNELSADPKVSSSKVGASVAVDAFVPIVPATPDRRGNSLSLTGELVYGHGIQRPLQPGSRGVCRTHAPTDDEDPP